MNINMPSLRERAASRRRSRRRGRREWSGDEIRELDAAARRRRRARLRDLPAEHYERAAVWARTDGTCGICGLQIDPAEEWHVDHIVPLAMADCPGDVLSNVQPSHPLCNWLKGHRSSATVMQEKCGCISACISACNADLDLTRPDPTRPDPSSSLTTEDQFGSSPALTTDRAIQAVKSR